MYGRHFVTGMDPYTPRGWVASRTPANQQFSGVGISAPCGAASTQKTTIFFSGLVELQMYGRINSGM